MKNSIKIFAFLLIFSFSSCTEFLEISPELDIDEDEVFSDFFSFQGFVEELYSCMPEMSRSTWAAEWNIADEMIASTNGPWRLNAQFDAGNYWAWENGAGWEQSWFNNGGQGVSTNPTDDFDKNMYPLSWYGIRKANLGLEKLELLTEATEGERNAIEGQLLFFRGFFHFQLMSYWGGLPYIDRFLGANEVLNFPRLSYVEAAEKAALDLERAAELLPVNWETSPLGQLTAGNNRLRVTSGTAYAYLGKNLLYAASPLMQEFSGGTATFDQELCRRAAEALGAMIEQTVTEGGESHYELLPWNQYVENWIRLEGSGQLPGYPEALLQPPMYTPWKSRVAGVERYLPPPVGGEATLSSPAANYVENYGMANGLPLDEPDAGYDPADPWSNRDPRFYQAFYYDGAQVVLGPLSPADEQYRFAQLHGQFGNPSSYGNLRGEAQGSRTGYLLKKFGYTGFNRFDNEMALALWTIPYLRLADVYLMYAEAISEGYGTPTASASTTDVTGVEAFNRVRNRAQLPDVDSRFTVDNIAFREILIQERAVELAFEGQRFCDLRRWKIADQTEYTEKTAHDFDRGPGGLPINFNERVVVNRVFEDRHWWFPWPIDAVSLYPDFQQNPGW